VQKEVKVVLSLKACIKLIMLPSLVFAGCLAQPMSQPCQSADELAFDRKFTREELLLLNLGHGQGSAGFFLLEALKQSKETTHNLQRAMSQMRQVEATYAKSKGKPDDKYLQNSELKLTQARQRSEELSENISDGFREMKRSVKETLLRNP
jgi:hypothetical protein